MSMIESEDQEQTQIVERRDVEAAVTEALHGVAGLRRENEQLRDVIERLTGEAGRLRTELSIEQAKNAMLDDSYRKVREERDGQMRLAVELSTQLTSAAAILTAGAEQASKMAKVRGELQAAGNGAAHRVDEVAKQLRRGDPIPQFLAKGPAVGDA